MANPTTITQLPIIQATDKDARGNTTTFETNAIGRVTKQIDPLTRTTTLTYNNAGNVATSTDALNRVTTLLYDQKNRLTR